MSTSRRLARSAAGKNALTRALARARVRVRALSVDRKATTMTEAAVATEVHQTLDVHLDFAAEIAFDAVLGLEQLADALDLVFRQLFGLLGRWDVRTRADLSRERMAHAIEVGERISDLLVSGKVNACNTSHTNNPLVRR